VLLGNWLLRLVLFRMGKMEEEEVEKIQVLQVQRSREGGRVGAFFGA